MLSGLHPGRIDLGLGPRARHRPAHDARPPARPPPDGRRRLPRAPRRAARLPRRRAARRPSLRPPGRPAPGPPAQARAVAARLQPPERGVGRRAGPALLLRRLHQPAGRRDRRGLPPPRRRPRPRSASWPSAPRPTRRPQRLALSHRMAFSLLRQGRLIPVPTSSTASATPRVGRSGRAAAASSWARPPRCGPGIEEAARGVRRGRGPRPHHHLRARGPAALLRADRAGARIGGYEPAAFAGSTERMSENPDELFGQEHVERYRETDGEVGHDWRGAPGADPDHQGPPQRRAARHPADLPALRGQPPDRRVQGRAAEPSRLVPEHPGGAEGRGPDQGRQASPRVRAPRARTRSPACGAR